MAEEVEPPLLEEKHPFMEKESHHGSSRSCCTLVVAVLAVLLAVSVLAIIGLVVALSLTLTQTSSDCTTPECVELAATVLQNMDPSVNPCEDFYNYSCGGWDANNVIPEGNGLWGVFEELDVNNKVHLKKLLEGDEENDVTAISYLRNLYRNCLDVSALTSRGAKPLLDLVNYTGGWDLIGVHNATAPKWSITGADFRMSKLLGNPAFFQFAVGVDDKNSSHAITQIMQDGLSLPSPDSYKSNSSLGALEKYITSILMVLYPSGEPGTLQAAAQDIVAFETALAQIFVSNVALRDPQATYNLYQLKELTDSNQWSQFNWTDYAVEMFKLAKVSVGSDLTVLMRTPSFFQNLTVLYNETSASTLENYFKWQLVSGYVPYLGSDFLSAYYSFTEVVLGTGKVERYITCIDSIENLAPMPLARLFTDYILPPGTRGNVSDLVTSIKDAFIERLKENKWIDDITRERSIWKVGNITQMIAYPDQISNDTYLLEKSEALKLSGGQDYFKTVQLAQVISATDNFAELTKPVDKTEWEIAPTEVNAYYEPLYNEFVFLEGILRAPFIVAAWPDYFKLGAMGLVIGHELTHGFDDQGQQYNQDGVLTPWWTNASVDAFKQRQGCFVEQYSQYSMFGYHINGNLTLGENIADNGGIKTAYQAFQTAAKTNPQPTLPAIDLTPDQLFFVAFGQVWCSIFTPAFIATNLQVNPHSPGPYRVVGAVSNSEDFATAFNCSVGTPMNPKNKCDLW